jgi:hypothetical protein
MGTTAVSNCNAAFLLIGADEINSLDEDTQEAKLANAVYDDTVEMLYQMYPWRFSLKYADLGGAVVATPELYKYQYQLPTDMLRLISLVGDYPYQVFSDRLHTDATVAKIIYQARISPEKMPAYFVRTLQYSLAKIFCMSLQEDSDKATMFDNMADKEMKRARSIDSQQQPNTSPPEVNYTLLNVRN